MINEDMVAYVFSVGVNPEVNIDTINSETNNIKEIEISVGENAKNQDDRSDESEYKSADKIEITNNLRVQRHGISNIHERCRQGCIREERCSSSGNSDYINARRDIGSMSVSLGQDSRMELCQDSRMELCQDSDLTAALNYNGHHYNAGEHPKQKVGIPNITQGVNSTILPPVTAGKRFKGTVESDLSMNDAHEVETFVISVTTDVDLIQVERTETLLLVQCW